MKHCFQNDDGEVVAADTAEQAGRYHDCELGGMKEPSGDWKQMDDARSLSIGDAGSHGETVTKSCREWASEHEKPCMVASTYC